MSEEISTILEDGYIASISETKASTPKPRHTEKLMSLVAKNKERLDDETYRQMCELLLNTHNSETHKYKAKFLVIRNDVMLHDLLEGEDQKLSLYIKTTRYYYNMEIYLTNGEHRRVKRLIENTDNGESDYEAWSHLLRNINVMSSEYTSVKRYKEKPGDNGVNVHYNSRLVEIVKLRLAEE